MGSYTEVNPPLTISHYRVYLKIIIFQIGGYLFLKFTRSQPDAKRNFFPVLSDSLKN